MKEIIKDRLLILMSYYEEDPDKYVSSIVIGFNPEKRVESMRLICELKNEGFLEMQSKTQVPLIKLTPKGYQKAKHCQLEQG